MKDKCKKYQFHFYKGMRWDFIVWATDKKDAKKNAIEFHKALIKEIQNDSGSIVKLTNVKPIYTPVLYGESI